MNIRTKLMGPAAALLAFAAAAPAAAQYYPEPRRGGVAEEIARTIGTAAEAVGTVTDAVRGAVHGLRFRNPADRYAAEVCGAYAERFGRISIHDVVPHRRDTLRVHGVIDGYDRRGDRGYRYGRFERRSFACTVRYDGRITKFKTKRLRY